MRAILTYHSVDPSGSPISVDPGTFRRHVDWLASGPVEITDVDTLLGMPDDADAAAITFDDGLRTFAAEAWPLLRERGLPATLFVVAGRVGADNRWGGRPEEGVPDLELMGWDELARVAEEGVTLASHGMTHRRLAGADPERVRSELAASRELIRERTGRDARGFAYPYGDADDFSRKVAAARYDWACTTSLAPLDEQSATFALPRLDMHYLRRPGSLESWGTRRFRWRIRLRRWARRARSAVAGPAPPRAGGGPEAGLAGTAEPRGAPGVAGATPDDASSSAAASGRDAAVHGDAPDGGDAPAPGPEGDGADPADAADRPDPDLSVIVPAHDAAEELHESLSALEASDLPRDRWELIVANDGADPETTAVARRYADAVVVLDGKPRGPSYARNRGAEVARGDVLVFVDADVRVHPDTLGRFREVLAERPDVAAVFGSYDDRPPAPGPVSTYRNLLHHQVHQRNAGEAETFWAGCGAVRREVFDGIGGYDEWHFSRPQIEDIELGRRIRLAGGRILLRPEIQATHLKRWRLWDVLKTDLLSRGIPWMRLVLHEGDGRGRRALNLSGRHRWCVALAGLAAAAALASAVSGAPWLLAGTAGAAGGVTALNLDFYRLVRRRGGWASALCAVPLHLLHYFFNGVSAVAGWIAYVTVGAPLPPVDVAAFREAGLDAAEPLPSPPSDSVWYRYDD